MSHEYAYVGGESEGKRMDREYQEMITQDESARDSSQLIGRYLKERAADGFAYYIIDGRNADGSLRLEHVAIYDGYTIPMYEGMIDCFPRQYALKNITAREEMETLFRKQDIG